MKKRNIQNPNCPGANLSNPTVMWSSIVLIVPIADNVLRWRLSAARQ